MVNLSSCSFRRLLLLILAFLILALSFFSHPRSVQADVAPPRQPKGSDLIPGEEITQVRMVSETVILSVSDLFYEEHLSAAFVDQNPELYENHYEHSLGRADVTAIFHMMNTGEKIESMYVRFPLNTFDGRGNYPEIVDLNVTVNGEQVETTTSQHQPLGQRGSPKTRGLASLVPFQFLIHSEVSSLGQPTNQLGKPNFLLEKWAEFFVSFPPGEEVVITVNYTLEAEGYPSSSFVTFSYIIESGAGWKDTIGTADIILHFPYQASQLNVILNENDPDWVIEGNQIRWYYEDLEPNRYNNFHFLVARPYDWRSMVLAEQENVKKDPDNDEAWGRLGKAYKHFAIPSNKGYLRTDPGGQELLQLSKQAYQKAIALDPDDALWHAGFGELLLKEWFWVKHTEDRDLLIRALSEFHEAYQLAPDDPVVQDLLESTRDILNGWKNMGLSTTESIFLILTPTATQTVSSTAPTPTETAALQPSKTPIPTETAALRSSMTPTPSDTPTSLASTPLPEEPGQETGFSPGSRLLPGIGILIILGGAFIYYFSQRKK